MSRSLRALGAVVLMSSLALAGCSSDDKKGDSGKSGSSSGAAKEGSAPEPTADSEFTAKKTASGTPANTTSMRLVRTISGNLTAKSVDASGTGLVTANNMIYTHTITLFNAGTGKRIVDIPDTVDLKDFGLSKTSVKLKGGPVEGVWSHDAKYYYVSNYVMSGPGYNDEPVDTCPATNKYKPSYIYRINIEKKKIDQVIEAGAVPKYVALTPDGSKLLVSNWCSYKLGVIDLAKKKQIKQIPIGAWPRGIVADPDNKHAYVAAFGTSNLYKVDLDKGTASVMDEIGPATRHITMSPDKKYLYVVASHANTVTKVERTTGKKVGQITGLIEPRSMTISPDGKAIYVVNYNAGTVTKIDTATMKKLQTVKVGSLPIGITYEKQTGQVWVSMYSGTIMVFDDNKAGATK